jgi:cytochrome P450
MRSLADTRSVITDLLSTEAVSDPHRVHGALREHAPVVWLPEHRAWFIGRHAGVHAAFRDPRLSSDRLTPLEARLDAHDRSVLGDTFDLLRGWMVFHDPPQHERLRGPVRRAFTPRAVDALRPHVAEVVDQCLDEMADDAAAVGSTDLVSRLAFPLPAIVIAELLGVPPGDRDEFKTWSAQLAAIVFGTADRSSQADRAAAGTARFVEYFTDLIAHYERRPADNLISALIAARDVADPPLAATELVGACTLLLFGGHETTTNLIGNAGRALADHPDQRRWLSEHPDGIAGAVEELHRYDGSSKVMVRIVGDTHVRDDARLEAGQTVFLGLSAAGRDPRVFDEPDTLRLDRPDAHRHLGFGHGLHFCLGAPLARLETQVAIEGLVRRFDTFELAVPHEQLEYGATILGHGLAALPLALPEPRPRRR